MTWYRSAHQLDAEHNLSIPCTAHTHIAAVAAGTFSEDAAVQQRPSLPLPIICKLSQQQARAGEHSLLVQGGRQLH